MKTIILSYPMTAILKKIQITLLTLAFLLFVLSAQAQFLDRLSNPQVTINLAHPPGLGLKVTKIAFGPASGNCSDQIIDAIKSDFVNNNIEVIDRENLTSILAEHEFTFSGYVNQASAAAIGKILGPSALVFVKVQRCATQVDKLIGKKTVMYKDYTTGTIPLYITRTRAFLKGSIQTVDLATGRIFSAQSFDYSPDRQNESTDGYPEAPAEFDVQDIAFRMMVNEVHRMFIPWTEATTLYYYDDKDFDLKLAYQALSIGNLDLAYDLSKKNLEACKNTSGVKDKILAHAYYNMGMSYMLRNEHDKALECFSEAAKLRPGDIVTSAIYDCKKAKKLMIAMQQVEEKASFDAEQKIAAETKAVQTDQANTLTNKDIIQLTQMKLSNSIIIQKIKNSKCIFDTSAEALVTLTNSGVNEEVIMVMMSK